MLDLRNLVENRAEAEKALKKRAGGSQWLPLLDEVVRADEQRRAAIQEVETLKNQRNVASQEIAKLKRQGQDPSKIMEEMKEVAARIKGLDGKVAEAESKLDALLLELPNLPHESVVVGSSSEQNVEQKRWGEPRRFDFAPKTHDEIGEKLGLLDFKKAGEVTGARFVFLRGLAAKLERALIQFMMDTHASAGYEEMIPPFLVNRASLTGTGQLPKFEEDVFCIEKFDFFLAPTAEVPVTNYHRQEILSEKDLPRKYVAYSPCFRSEAGSYGRDTKGLKRQHQFNKVELVKFTRPEESYQELEFLLQDAERILQLLKLPYRVMALCGGDMGFGAAKTYDIEVWSPGANVYMEISSCSNFTDFQARRASIRYREDKSGKVRFVHTLNGSGLAIGRTLIAIMENYQRADGTFDVPTALVPYLKN